MYSFPFTTTLAAPLLLGGFTVPFGIAILLHDRCCLSSINKLAAVRAAVLSKQKVVKLVRLYFEIKSYYTIEIYYLVIFHLHHAELLLYRVVLLGLCRLPSLIILLHSRYSMYLNYYIPKYIDIRYLKTL